MKKSQSFRAAIQQLEFLRSEISLMVNRRWWRWFGVLFGTSFLIIAIYRFDRALFLLLGRLWILLRILLSPVAFVLGPWTGRWHCTIHYQAEIDKGLRILHPELGILVTKYAVAGKSLTLTGGNLIGGKRGLKFGDITIGDNVILGAQAVVLGPIKIGNNTIIGAGSVALENVGDDNVIFGVPAHPLFTRQQPK